MSRMTWLQERRMEKFDDVLGRFEAKRLSAMDAAELLGMSERTFRRYRRRYEEDGLEGLFDRRLGKASSRRVPVDRVAWVLEQYRSRHMGWTVKHFHDHLRARHGFALSYSWTKTTLQHAGLVSRAPRRGAHRRRRPRKPCVGMMLHQSLPPRRRGTARAMSGWPASRRWTRSSPWTTRPRRSTRPSWLRRKAVHRPSGR